MSGEELRITELDESMRTECIDYAEELGRSDRELVPWPLTQLVEDFPAYVTFLKDSSLGVGLKDGWVPSSTYFLVNGSCRILGVANLRHRLTEHLLREGGHIGYSVRPSERRKGHATAMCAMVLEKAREMGIERVLITCDKDNLASARVIQKNVGVLENETISNETGKIKQRYWIDLAASDQERGHRQ